MTHVGPVEILLGDAAETLRGVPKCKCGKVVTGYRHKERNGLCVNCLIDAYVELMGQARLAAALTDRLCPRRKAGHQMTSEQARQLQAKSAEARRTKNQGQKPATTGE